MVEFDFIFKIRIIFSNYYQGQKPVNKTDGNKKGAVYCFNLF